MILQKNLPLCNFLACIILALLFIDSLVLAFSKMPAVGLFFLTASATAFLIFRKLKKHIFSGYHGDIDSIEGKINLAAENITEKEKILQSLSPKHEKISFLFEVSKKFIELSEPEEIYDFLLSTLDKLFPQADNILVFDFEKGQDNLSLVRSLKRKFAVIKEKKGGIIDSWILRHNSSLLIDDLIKDFRFDSYRVEAYTQRGCQSFVGSPFSIAEKPLGIVRMESVNPGVFSFDDSRLLRNICELAAVVLERGRLFEKARELAIRDSLTGLYLKDYFFDRLNHEFKRMNEGTSCGVIMADIDDFKKINDTYGHVVGDKVIIAISKILAALTKIPGMICGRFGGEEFVVLYPGCGLQSLVGLAERIRQEVNKTDLSFRRNTVHFTVSLGLALYPDTGKDALSLVKAADERLYKAKKEGKDRICFS
ncbi:MAG: sensor domain-containing diguanylate cyclase [Candidatus Omnitrophica bacterium]|nr:sensor domain-containing diguanylate cyclase [Candidatus Omnitrophota bacterium]MDD5430474.1 sensor domain-containing diguanylate cyclase [Candidatus Omnitrophota bacterium]